MTMREIDSELIHGNGVHGVPPNGKTLHEAVEPHLDAMEMLLRVADYTVADIDRKEHEQLNTLLYAACWAKFFRHPAGQIVVGAIHLHQYPGDTVVDLMDLFCSLFPGIEREEARSVAQVLVFGEVVEYG